MAVAIGIDVGGTNVKGVLVKDTGEILHQEEKPTPSHAVDSNGHEQPWQQVVSQVIQGLKSKSNDAVDAIGLAAPGLPNEANAAIRIMPGRLDGLENLVWSEFLHEREVWVLNDAHAALIAEAKFGVGQGISNIVMLTLGTGVGGGILINGELYQGNYQMAGHLGHMTLDADQEEAGITGMPGTLESAIGDATVAKRSFGKYNTTLALVNAYRQGDGLASYVWLNSVRKLALALCSLCNLLSPDQIILGGGITQAGDALYKPLAEFITVYEWKCAGKSTPIQQARYSNLAGAVGAAAFALERALCGQLK